MNERIKELNNYVDVQLAALDVKKPVYTLIADNGNHLSELRALYLNKLLQAKKDKKLKISICYVNCVEVFNNHAFIQHELFDNVTIALVKTLCPAPTAKKAKSDAAPGDDALSARFSGFDPLPVLAHASFFKSNVNPKETPATKGSKRKVDDEKPAASFR